MSCRTQRRLALDGVVSPQMERVAQREYLPADTIREEVARGRMVIPANVHHVEGALEPMAIGLRARVKINANIGNSPTSSSLDEEVEKLHLSQRWRQPPFAKAKKTLSVDADGQRGSPDHRAVTNW